MPQKTFVVPHHLSRNTLVTILVAHLFYEVSHELKEGSPSIRSRWINNRGEFYFPAMGKQVRAVVDISEDMLEAKFAISVDQEMGVFLEAIEQTVREKAEYLFANSDKVIASSVGRVS